METSVASIKDEARRIIDQLPDTATWEDLIYRIYVRQSIEAGLKDAEEGHVESVEEVRRSFRTAGVPPSSRSGEVLDGAITRRPESPFCLMPGRSLSVSGTRSRVVGDKRTELRRAASEL